MKMLCSTIVILCFAAAPFSVAAPKKPIKKESLGAKASKPSKPAPADTTGDPAIDALAAYTTAEQLALMPTCLVTVIQRAPCYCMLKTEDGTVFRVGSPANTAVLGKFVGTLEQGKTYTFPDAFVAFAKTQEKPM
jgi:hypothetical protein